MSIWSIEKLFLYGIWYCTAFSLPKSDVNQAYNSYQKPRTVPYWRLKRWHHFLLVEGSLRSFCPPFLCSLKKGNDSMFVVKLTTKVLQIPGSASIKCTRDMNSFLHTTVSIGFEHELQAQFFKGHDLKKKHSVQRMNIRNKNQNRKS